MKLSKYLANNQIKENLGKEELSKLKEEDLVKLGSRKKECYLWEIEKELKNS
ncbi:hypothetical protein [endosymbiont GvMRE of Glomus versiforme]|uniref:hypothetical protein n=1 Tax=endosymbiont GvMRE of Glomus versiforme TaxID=2039283 RepID=UPI000EE69C20|nr:hypothetical protein [endosymbiont GvMRE of Glomus versiforme]RHZ36083.1 hypothetical protein GvMRE_Ic3g129 [endosymbiont GvMRE of Glomus versiforme]